MEHYATGLSWNPKVPRLFSLQRPASQLAFFKAPPSTSTRRPYSPPIMPFRRLRHHLFLTHLPHQLRVQVTLPRCCRTRSRCRTDNHLRKVEKSEVTHKNPAPRAPSNRQQRLILVAKKHETPVALTKKHDKFALEITSGLSYVPFFPTFQTKPDGSHLGVPRK